MSIKGLDQDEVGASVEKPPDLLRECGPGFFEGQRTEGGEQFLRGTYGSCDQRRAVSPLLAGHSGRKCVDAARLRLEMTMGELPGDPSERIFVSMISAPAAM
jgi:hypothetical protein